MSEVESKAATLRLQLLAAGLVVAGVVWPAVELSVERPGFSPVTASYSWAEVPGAGGFTALLSALAALGAMLWLRRSPDTLWLAKVGWALTGGAHAVRSGMVRRAHVRRTPRGPSNRGRARRGDGRSAHPGARVFARIRRGQEAACGQHRHRSRRSDRTLGGAGPALARLPSSEGTTRARGPRAGVGTLFKASRQGSTEGASGGARQSSHGAGAGFAPPAVNLSVMAIIPTAVRARRREIGARRRDILGQFLSVAGGAPVAPGFSVGPATALAES